MTSLQASAPASTDKSYDPEIKDMADYVHNYKVDSDLAVRSLGCLFVYLLPIVHVNANGQIPI